MGAGSQNPGARRRGSQDDPVQAAKRLNSTAQGYDLKPLRGIRRMMIQISIMRTRL
jgi:hypothetical protein